MKHTFVVFLSLFSTLTMAHTIEGTLMLPGSLKTKVTVKNVSTTCKVKVGKINNLMQEDVFGNPAYKAKIDVSLDGSDSDKKITIKLKKEITVINLFGTGANTEVRDLHYVSQDPIENVTVMIDSEGRFESVALPYENKLVTCQF